MSEMERKLKELTGYEGKKMVPVYPGEWEVDDDRAYRCPHCDSLNVDEALSRYQLDESVDPAG